MVGALGIAVVGCAEGVSVGVAEGLGVGTALVGKKVGKPGGTPTVAP